LRERYLPQLADRYSNANARTEDGEEEVARGGSPARRSLLTWPVRLALALLILTVSWSARATTVLAFVIYTPNGSGTGFLVKNPGDQVGTFIVTALHVVRGAACAAAQPFPACSTDPLAKTSKNEFKKFESCTQPLPPGVTLIRPKHQTLVWLGHDLAAIRVDDNIALPVGSSAGHIGPASTLPSTARWLFLQAAGFADCPNGEGRLRYYTRAGALADWAAARSHGQYVARDYIGTLRQERQLLVMSSTGSPGASGGAVTTEAESDQIVAMYQGGDGRGQATWAVVLTNETLRGEVPQARPFGDWTGLGSGKPTFQHADESLGLAGEQLENRIKRPQASFSLEGAALFETAFGGASPVHEAGGTLAAGGNIATWLGGLELWLAGSFTHRVGSVRFDSPAAFGQSEALQEQTGIGNSLGAEVGFHWRLTRRDRFPAINSDLLVRGRAVGEDGIENGEQRTTWQGVVGPLTRVRACGNLLWDLSLCAGVGIVYEYYRPMTYVYDGFGALSPASRTWQLRPQALLGVQYAP
jgi:hypothetical protein